MIIKKIITFYRIIYYDYFFMCTFLNKFVVAVLIAVRVVNACVCCPHYF
jgi:hypothetical protein